MEQERGASTMEGLVALLFTLAGLEVLGVSISSEAFPRAEDSLLGLLLLAMVIVADRFPIQLTRGTKLVLSNIPIYLAAVMLPARVAILVAGIGVLITSLLARRERGLLSRDILSSAGQWMVMAFLGYQVAHIPLLLVSANLTRFVLLIASGCTFLLADLLFFSLSISFALREPFWISLRTTLANGLGAESAQYLVAIIGALAADYEIWALLLLVLPTMILYVAIKNSKEVRRETLGVLEDMADTVDMRDVYTGGHARRVAGLVQRILVRMRIFGPEARLIEIAARLHDIGKMGIPDEVLQKPGRLLPAEMALMQTHSEIGATLISKYHDFARGALMIRHHHEKWDGTGYPAHLCEHEIPFGARVIAVADSYDAMISDRPYRQALAPRQALEVLIAGRGSQWEPAIVDAFVDIISGELDQQAARSLAVAEPSIVLPGNLQPSP